MKGVILTRFMPQGTTVNADTYYQVLQDCIWQFGINSPHGSAN